MAELRARIKEPPTPETLLSIKILKSGDMKKNLAYSGNNASD